MKSRNEAGKLREWIQNIELDFGVKCEIRTARDTIGFYLILYYFYYKKGKIMYKAFNQYFERIPDDYSEWFKKNSKKIAKTLSI